MSKTRDQLIDELLARDAIRDVILRFARGLDRLDWQSVRDCYWDDAHDDHGPFEGAPDEFVAWGREFLPSWTESTSHLILNCLIDVDGDTAHAETYSIGCHRAIDDDAPYDLFTQIRYLDRFERRHGQWRIADRVLAWDWTRKDPIVGGWDDGGAEYRWGTRNDEDPLYHLTPARRPGSGQ